MARLQSMTQFVWIRIDQYRPVRFNHPRLGGVFHFQVDIAQQKILKMGEKCDSNDPLSIFKNLDQDLEKYLSPDSVVENFQRNTNHNELVGQLVSIEGPTIRRNRKTGKEVNVINLEVRIGSPQKVAVAIWGEGIERLRSSLKNGHIMLFESLFVVETEPNKFNFNRGLNISCQAKTQIYSLNDLNRKTEDRTNLRIYTNIQEALDETDGNQLICLHAYLKIGFVNKSGRLIGAISDDHVNMETWITANVVTKVIEEGRYFQLYGKFTETDNRIHFSVNDFDDIQLLDVPKASIIQLYKSLESPKKKRRVES